MIPETGRRIGRKRYLGIVILWNLVNLAFGTLIETQLIYLQIPIWTVIAVALLPILGGIHATMLRLHDLNLTGWWQFFTIPLAAVFFLFAPELLIIVIIAAGLFSIALLIVPGTPGANRYGLPRGSALYPVNAPLDPRDYLQNPRTLPPPRRGGPASAFALGIVVTLIAVWVFVPTENTKANLRSQALLAVASGRESLADLTRQVSVWIGGEDLPLGPRYVSDTPTRGIIDGTSKR